MKFLRACSKQCRNNLHTDSTYLQTVQKTMCKIHIHILSTHSVLLHILTHLYRDNVQNTHTYTQYTQCTITHTYRLIQRQCTEYTTYTQYTQCTITHTYRLIQRQCAEYTHIYSVHTVYYKDIIINDTLYTVCTHSTLSTHLYIVICEGATDYTFAMSWMCIVLYSLSHSHSLSLSIGSVSPWGVYLYMSMFT